MGWLNVRKRAGASAAGTLAARTAAEVVTCGWMRVKRTDFCLWSAPATALAQTIGALRGAGFDRVLHEPLYGQPDCMSHLNSTKVPAVSENILLCAMHAQRMQLSIAQDRNPFRRGVHF